MADSVTQTSISQPWGPQGTGLQYGYDQARSIFDNLRSSPYDPFGATTKASLAGLKATAAGDNPFLSGVTDTVSGLASGQMGLGTGDKFDSIFGQFSQPGSLSGGAYNDIASGGYLNGNPYADSVLNTQLDDITARVKAASGGFGSNFNTSNLVSQLGDVSNQFNLGRYDLDMQNLLRAAEGRSAEATSRGNTALSAASGLTGVRSEDIANRIAGVNAVPAADAFRYADAERLAQVGAAEDQQRAALRSLPQEDLNWYQSIFGTIPGSAGTQQSTSTQKDNSNGWLNALGLGLGAAGVAASIFG